MIPRRRGRHLSLTRIPGGGFLDAGFYRSRVRGSRLHGSGDLWVTKTSPDRDRFVTSAGYRAIVRPAHGLGRQEMGGSLGPTPSPAPRDGGIARAQVALFMNRVPCPPVGRVAPRAGRPSFGPRLAGVSPPLADRITGLPRGFGSQCHARLERRARSAPPEHRHAVWPAEAGPCAGTNGPRQGGHEHRGAARGDRPWPTGAADLSGSRIIQARSGPRTPCYSQRVLSLRTRR
jgi:hypothetical protein